MGPTMTARLGMLQQQMTDSSRRHTDACIFKTLHGGGGRCCAQHRHSHGMALFVIGRVELGECKRTACWGRVTDCSDQMRVAPMSGLAGLEW
jgi:hypothetical protein